MGAQTFLTTGAVALLMLNVTNINRSYVNATQESLSQQRQLDALNFGLSISEQIYAEAYDYNNIYSKYSIYNNVEVLSSRMDKVSDFGDTLSATISFSNQKDILLGEVGFEVTVTSYYWMNGEAEQVSTHLVPIIPLE